MTTDAITEHGRRFDQHVNFCGSCRDILELCPEGLRLHALYYGAWVVEHERAMVRQKLAVRVEPLGALCEQVN
jgi:hypothetical protein